MEFLLLIPLVECLQLKPLLILLEVLLQQVVSLEVNKLLLLLVKVYLVQTLLLLLHLPLQHLYLVELQLHLKLLLLIPLEELDRHHHYLVLKLTLLQLIQHLVHSDKRLVIQLQHQLLYLGHLVRMVKLNLEVVFSDHLLANNNLIHCLALDLLRLKQINSKFRLKIKKLL